MFSPCSLLVVGWFQPLLFLNTVGFYSKDNQNTVSHSNTDCKLKKKGLFTLKGVTILSALRLKTLCQGYNIADCPVFGSRHHYAMANKTVSFPLKKHHLLADGLLCCVCVCNPNRAGVKTAKYSSGERHFFFFFFWFWHKHHPALSLMWGFTGLRWFQSQSQSTTQQWRCQHW